MNLSRHDIDYLIRMFELNDGEEISPDAKQRIENLITKLDGKAKQNAARLLLQNIIKWGK